MHYMMLRGFYAKEDTRTPFFIQLVIAAVNIVAGRRPDAPTSAPIEVATMLALAYGLAYLRGPGGLDAPCCPVRIGSVVDRETVRFVVRLALVCAARGRRDAPGPLGLGPVRGRRSSSHRCPHSASSPSWAWPAPPPPSWSLACCGVEELGVCRRKRPAAGLTPVRWSVVRPRTLAEED